MIGDGATLCLASITLGKDTGEVCKGGVLHGTLKERLTDKLQLLSPGWMQAFSYGSNDTGRVSHQVLTVFTHS